MLKPVRKIGPIIPYSQYKDTKDPCIVFDGTTWHIFGSGGDTYPEEWEILHATAPSLDGPWQEQPTVRLLGVEGPHVAAPSVIYDAEDKLFHMAVQKDFMDVGGGIAYLVSADGHVFSKMRTLISPNKGVNAGLYDPHLSVINNQKFMVYASMPELATKTDPNGNQYKVPQPDVYLARSVTNRWAGIWKRSKAILRHEDIEWHHNSREHPDYEWGIEGPQIVELKNGLILLNATCFVAEGKRGTRQRVFFALAKNVLGPYTSIGPVLPTTELDLPEWENGENGHASAVVDGDELYLFYQARSQKLEPKEENCWRYGIAVFSIDEILEAAAAEQLL